MKRQSVLGTVTKTQLRVHQQEELPFSNLDRKESLPVCVQICRIRNILRH
jgi:hypothetical protein